MLVSLTLRSDNLLFVLVQTEGHLSFPTIDGLMQQRLTENRLLQRLSSGLIWPK